MNAPTVHIPDKMFFRIGEVSEITGVKPYVLRYWESEFDELKPAKNRAGNRIYTNRDIKLILYIKKLLRDERYTIEGAKQVLKNYTPDGAFGEQLELIDAPAPRAKIKDEQLRADVIGSGDNTLKLWEIKSWKLIATFFGEGGIRCVQFAPQMKT